MQPIGRKCLLTNNAINPQRTPLPEYPTSASTDSDPGPVNASVNAATPRTNVYSYPPLVMKKPFLMCTLKAATSITLKMSVAAVGVSNPSARRSPPPVSANPRHLRVAPAWREPNHREELTSGVKGSASNS
jgi:hypothetical protein